MCGKEKQRSRGYWHIKENYVATALDCSSMGEFRKRYPTGYASVFKKWWMSDLCKLGS
jgi:hypothetical protein